MSISIAAKQGRFAIAMAFPCVLILSSCTDRTPSSSATSVEESAKGLAKLFQRECIDQLDLAWVRKEMERRRWSACGGAPNDDDCTMNAIETIDWTVKTTSGSEIIVAVMPPHLGEVPKPGLSECNIALAEEPGKLLKDTVSYLKVGGKALSGPFEKVTPGRSKNNRTWEWRLKGQPNGRARIMLIYIHPLDEYKEYLQSQTPPGAADAQIWNTYEWEQKHPWILYYLPS